MDISDDYTQIILDSIAEGVFTVDKDWKIKSFNKAAEKITKVSKEEALGHYCWDVLRASICETGCPLKETMKSGKSVINDSIFIINADGEQVPITISTAILKDRKGKIIGGVESFRDLSIEQQLRKELADKHSFLDIISKNKKMHKLFSMVEIVSKTYTTVLIEGESGTGKELFAKAIHDLSPRKNGPMITVNSSSLPDTLLESELFGYKKGAFTDAKKDKLGRFALAKEGTLFLDEIGDISPMMQVRLLRVLQEKNYEPLGSTEPEKADVRVVLATNQNLDMLVKQQKFRKDLYYRINVVKISLPPLRERKEDIALLIDYFIHKFNKINSTHITTISKKALACLLAYEYPGNVRELENIIEYSSMMAQKGIIEQIHLPEIFKEKQDKDKIVVDSLKEAEKQVVLKALDMNDWNRTATAAYLGISSTTLWRKMKRFSILQNNLTKMEER